MTGTPKGETATKEQPKNEGTNNTTQQGNSVDTAELERQRKATEQAQMRANQLENELKRTKELEEARWAKELEEQNKWKELAEQREAKLNAIEEQREAEERQQELSTVADEVFEGFSQEVVEIAMDTGLGLTDTTDEAKTQLKEKLERIQSKVSQTSKPTPNNPNTADSKQTVEQQIETLRYGTGTQKQQVKQELIGNLEAVQQMKRMSGYVDPK